MGCGNEIMLGEYGWEWYLGRYFNRENFALKWLSWLFDINIWNWHWKCEIERGNDMNGGISHVLTQSLRRFE